jgi:NTE family protein
LFDDAAAQAFGDFGGAIAARVDDEDLRIRHDAPDVADELPKDATAIRRRVGEIVFNSSLVAEMQAICAMRAIAARADHPASVANLRLHRIGPPRRELFERGSALERSRAWLELLFDEGRRAARQFLDKNGADVGVRETLDVARIFTDAHKPKVRVAANDDGCASVAAD